MNDRFDRHERIGRVGAHRAPEHHWWRWWMTLLVCVASVVVLTVAGIALLNSMRGEQIDIAESVTVEPLTDPSQITDASVTVTVMDASGTEGLAAGVGQTLINEGWPVVADGTATDQAAETTIFYTDESQQAIALGIAEVLGIGTAEQSDAVISGSPITVVLGDDAVGVAPSTEPSASTTPSESITP